MKDYKKILEGVVNIINTAEKSDTGFVNICSYIGENCPEFKESEDEKIRKGLIEYFKDFRLGTFAYLEPKKIIAWLERQGEHSVSSLFTFEDVLTIQCAMAYAKFQDRELNVALKKLHDKVYDAYHDSKNHHIESQDGLKGEQIPANSAKTCKDEQKPYGKREECYDCQMNYGGTCKGSCAMKRGEQKPFDKVEPKDYRSVDPHFFKPANKVEPKFKVGDWIIFNGLTLYIKGIVKGYYRTISIDGIPNSYDWDIDNAARLWTIQDAKDGDVLFHSDSASNGIFIFKELLKWGFNEEVICYCDYDSEDGFCLGDRHTCCWADAKILHPATREQRDLLFQKMEEAGYEWDAEKKELKKIEQKPAENEELTEFDKAVGVSIGTWNPKSPEQIQSVKAVSKKLLKLAKKQINDEQKPVEWSKDDEQYLLICKNALSKYQVSDKWDAGIISRWLEERLKSIRPQNTWKPSEEHIHGLIWVINRMPDPKKANEAEAVLRDLLEQLNKLRKG